MKRFLLCMPARPKRIAPIAIGALTFATAAAIGAPPASAAPKAAPKEDRSFAERSMRVAKKSEGVPYRAGGNSPRGFDCSGFTQHVYSQLDEKIPRTSQQQFDHARKVDGKPRVGDLIFFHSGSTASVYHVAIYAGKNRIWHSPRSGEEVHRARIWSDNWIAGRY